MSSGKNGFNWDFERDQPWLVTHRERLARDAAIARFDGTLTPPSARDSAWIARELGDVPYDRVVGLTCHYNPVMWSSPFNINLPWPGGTSPGFRLGSE
jgi:hypothetical protein